MTTKAFPREDVECGKSVAIARCHCLVFHFRHLNGLSLNFLQLFQEIKSLRAEGTGKDALEEKTRETVGMRRKASIAVLPQLKPRTVSGGNRSCSCERKENAYLSSSSEMIT